MDDIEIVKVPTNEFFKKYKISKQQYIGRCEALLNDIDKYIEKSKLKNTQVQLNRYSLHLMLMDYFIDIGRLKEFHHIEHVNSIKIVSYISYWFLKRKPIQVLSNDDELLYINEKFITLYILDFLMNESRGNILDREELGLVNFRKQLYYCLCYRHFDAQALEMILIAFFGGQIYQSIDKDLSSKLPKSEAKDFQ